MEKLPTNTKPQEAKIELKPIKGLIKPLTKITREIKKNIDNGEYAMVLGDDASGRLPALAMMEIINKANTKVARPKVDTRFIALYPTWSYGLAWGDLIGKTRAASEKPKTDAEKEQEKLKRANWTEEDILLSALLEKSIKSNPGMTVDMGNVTVEQKQEAAAKKIKEEFVDKLDKGLFANNKKILIVTELVESGTTLPSLFTALRESGIPFEVAIIKHAYDSKIDNLRAQGIQTYTGGIDAENLRGRNDLSGVRKNGIQYQLRTELIKNTDPQNPEEKQKSKNIQETINIARQDVHLVANKVFETVWRKKKN